MNIFCVSLILFPITIVTAFFDDGVCCPIIFGITLVIPYLKLCFWSKLLGKGIVEVVIPKPSCLHFMVIPCLTLFGDLIEVYSIDILLLCLWESPNSGS